jgi:hypothetical protein
MKVTGSGRVAGAGYYKAYEPRTIARPSIAIKSSYRSSISRAMKLSRVANVFYAAAGASAAYTGDIVQYCKTTEYFQHPSRLLVDLLIHCGIRD